MDYVLSINEKSFTKCGMSHPKCPICNKNIVTKKAIQYMRKNNLFPPSNNNIHNYECDQRIKSFGYSFDENYKIKGDTHFLLTNDDIRSEEITGKYRFDKWLINSTILGYINVKKEDNKIYISKEESLPEEHNKDLIQTINQTFEEYEIIYK